MKILIDNGHGEETPGKRSPDGRLREYKWARECAGRLVAALKAQGIDAERVVTENTDISLRTRCNRVNNVCSTIGTENVICISIHNNAAGNNAQWMNARGFTAHVALNASKSSKRLAKCLWDAAIDKGVQGNRSIPAVGYISQNLAICRDTNCPAVLTENLFQDNKDDVAFLLSEEGMQTMVDVHVLGIKRYLAL